MTNASSFLTFAFCLLPSDLICILPKMPSRRPNVLMDSLQAERCPCSPGGTASAAGQNLDAAAGMDAWIDTHHAVRGFVRGQSFVFLTDSAVGTREEHTTASSGPSTWAPTSRATGSCRSSRRSIRSIFASRMPNEPGTRVFRPSWSSAATSRSVRPGWWSTPGSCARRSARTCPSSRLAAVGQSARQPRAAGSTIYKPTPVSRVSSS